MKTLSIVGVLAISGGAALSQEILKREPPRGVLKTGTTVLVDDGSCPRGQIKQVTGGTLGSGGTRGGGGVAQGRERRCISR